MSLDLDPRQRAILREMGLRVWSPLSTAAPASASVPVAPADVTSAVAPASALVQALTSASASGSATAADSAVAIELPAQAVTANMRLGADVASLSWSELHQAVMQCQRCKQSVGRRSPVMEPADPGRVDWLVLGEPPDDKEERAGQALAGPAGILLDNMLRAVGVARVSATAGTGLTKVLSWRAHVSNVVKCRPAIMRNPDAHDLASCESYLRREVELLRPRVILALGRFAAQSLLQGDVPDIASIPLGKLRGQVYRYQGVPVVVSYHPNYLLRTPQDKGRAWVDLCLASRQIGA